MLNLFSRAPTVATSAERELTRVLRRYADGEITRSTMYNQRRLLLRIAKLLGSTRMDRVTPPDVMALIRSVQGEGFSNTAQKVRKMLSRLAYECIEAGEIPAGCNPARAVRSPPAPVQRTRLSLEMWREMLTVAEREWYPYLYRGMLLAVVTAQRRGDIARMRFEDVVDGCLRVEQEKTGARVAIPLALRCDASGWSVGEVIDLCRDGSGSPYLLHTVHNPPRYLHPLNLSRHFGRLRTAVCGEWRDEGTPPTYHEQRSLAERLYSDQGIDTRKLLGHRRQSMTDTYNSTRRLREWVTISTEPKK
jgi:integrase